jgi:hypothetical protein
MWGVVKTVFWIIMSLTSLSGLVVIILLFVFVRVGLTLTSTW